MYIQNSQFLPNSVSESLFHNTSLQKNFYDLNRYLNKKDFEAIIKDSELFFLAYCKVVQSNQNQNQNDKHHFFVSTDGKNVRVLGKEAIIKAVSVYIEEFRRLLIESFDNRIPLNLVSIDKTLVFFIKKESPIIDLTLDFSGCYADWYHRFIKPVLPKLVELCGGIYTEYKKHQEVISCLNFPAESKFVDAIRINWQEGVHLVYKISPIPIPEREKLDTIVYSLYKQNIGCDFSLITKENHNISVHKIVVIAHGDEVLQAKALKSVKIHFNYSHNTIQSFAEFIYLGSKRFLENYHSQKYQYPIDWIDLFLFASDFKIKELIDCCTNLMCIYATPKDLPGLQYCINLTDNEHLIKLYEYLLTKNIAIKV